MSSWDPLASALGGMLEVAKDPVAASRTTSPWQGPMAQSAPKRPIVHMHRCNVVSAPWSSVVVAHVPRGYEQLPGQDGAQAALPRVRLRLRLRLATMLQIRLVLRLSVRVI